MSIDYRPYADAGIAALQQWYDPATGLWKSTGWWNAANALEVVIDYAARTGSGAYHSVIETTFKKNKGGKFLNRYYDDEGWWALAWLKAYDLLGDVRYLAMAQTIFADMQKGWDAVCGGGVWWSKDRTYKNAIPNELFITLAARLYLRVTDAHKRTAYLEWAQQAWAWFAGSGVINARNLINDGLDGSCRNNGQTTWTYNQGVILGGLVELHKISGDSSYLSRAEAIANAALSELVDSNGILREPCEPSDCGGDGPQFKGIFIRNLAYLYGTDGNVAYRQFILNNAESIVLRDCTSAYQFGLKWAGPVDSVDAARQSAALDAINAALLVQD